MSSQTCGPRGCPPAARVIAPLLFIAVLVAGFSGLLARPGETVSPTEAQDLVQRGARLLDVRTPAEFAAGHVSGALNVPVQELAGRLGDLGPTDQPIVVYCRSGSRSARAAELLRETGFQNVHDLGAMSRWPAPLVR